MDGDGISSESFGADRDGWGEKMCGAAQIGYGIKWGCERTSGVGRMTKASGDRLN